MVDRSLLNFLVCPVSGGPLLLKSDLRELWCLKSGLAYPLNEGIPVLLKQAARCLSSAERASLQEAPWTDAWLTASGRY